MSQLNFHDDQLKTPPQRKFAKSDLPILTKIISAYKIWWPIFGHFTKLSKFTLGERIDTVFIELIEILSLAVYSEGEQKNRRLNSASIQLDKLKVLLQLGWEIRVLGTSQYTNISLALSEIGKMLGGWRAKK